MANATLEQREAEAPTGATAVTRVLAGDDMVLRVRHQAQHHAALVAHTSDRVDRPVRVVPGVGERHLTVGGERSGVGVHVATFTMSDRALDWVQALRPHAAPSGGFQSHPLALEVAALVVAERSRQQARAGEHLEPVADTDDRVTGSDERAQLVTDANGALELDLRLCPIASFRNAMFELIQAAA